MNVRQKKELLIEEIQKLRALVSIISYTTYTVDGVEEKIANTNKEETFKKIDEIHDIIFGI